MVRRMVICMEKCKWYVYVRRRTKYKEFFCSLIQAVGKRVLLDLAAEGRLEFVDIWVAAHCWKAFHSFSMQFVFRSILDLVKGCAKLESFQCQLIWGKIWSRSAQSSAENRYSEKCKDHGNWFECHVELYWSAKCFDCWLKVEIQLLIKSKIFAALYIHDFLDNTMGATESRVFDGSIDSYLA